ncbi:MAG: crotonase/enoyl-CoA hydratase family protein [Caulobacteraceae bacterium]|nr:crotonase/enoyl-CoA hydratase family protein [Caulobacteraceae bacterium]
MKVLIESHGPVWTVIINRPEVRNAVDPETARLLRDAFDAFEDDAEARVAVLTGAGGTFCSGFDLTAVGDAAYDPEDPDGPMGPTRRLLDKPVIAAVEGHAVAGGLELALWCDMRVASRSAVFGVLCRRWGVPLIDGGTVRLPRVVGHGRAMDMILTGRPVGPDEALIFGLIDRLYPEGQAREKAEALAHDIAEFPQLCLQADRRSAHTQWGAGSLTDALKAEARGGVEPLRLEGLDGARRFAGGAGRGGAAD